VTGYANVIDSEYYYTYYISDKNKAILPK